MTRRRAIGASKSGVRSIVSNIELTQSLVGQVIETPDGLPYIGPSTDHQYSDRVRRQWPDVWHARRHDHFRTSFSTLESLERIVRSGPEGGHAWCIGLHQRKRRLSVLPDSGSVCGSEAKSVQRSNAAKVRFWNEMARRLRRFATKLERSHCAPPFAPRMGCKWAGTRPSGHGIARVMGHASRRPAT